MKLDEAIEYLTELKDGCGEEDLPKHRKAAEIGIEAMKVIRDKRGYPDYIIPLQLPGETKD